MGTNIRHLAISYKSSMFAVAEFEKIIYIWDFDKDLRIRTIESILDFGGKRLAISPDGKLCAAGAYNKNGIALYSIETGELLWNRRDLKNVQSLKFNYNGNKLYACFDTKPMNIINSYTGDVIDTLSGKRDIWFDQNENVYLIEDSDLELINNDLNKSFIIGRESFATLDVAYSENAVLISEANGPLRLISILDGKEKWRFRLPDNHILKIGCNKKCGLVFGILWNFQQGGNKKLYTFDYDSGRVLSTMELEEDCGIVDFIEDASYAICSNGNVYCLFDIEPKTVKRFDFNT